MKKERIKLLKESIFLLFESLNENTMSLPIIYILFLIFECLHFLSISALCQSTLDEYSSINTRIFELVIIPAEFFFMHNDVVKFACIIMFLLLMSTLAIAMYLCYKYLKNKENNTTSVLTSYFAWLISFILLFSTRIYIFLIIGMLEDELLNMQQTYFIFIFSLISTLILIIVNIFHFIFANTPDPSSKLAWANNTPKIDFERYLTKIFLITAYYFDTDKSFWFIYGFGGLAMTGYSAFTLTQMPYLFKRKIYVTLALIHSLNLTCMISFVINFATGSAYICPLHWLFVFPVFLITILGFKTKNLEYKINNFALGQNISLATFIEVVQTILIYIKYSENHPKLIGFLILHHTNCKQLNCKCKSINYDMSMGEGSEHISPQQRDSLIGPVVSIKANVASLHSRMKEERNLLYALLVDIINDTEHMDASPSHLLLQKAYVQGIFLYKKEMAIYTMAQLNGLHQNIYLQFLILSFTRKMENDFQTQLKKEDTKHITLSTIVRFQKEYMHFHSLIKNSTTYYISFWSEFAQKIPDYERLIEKGNILHLTNFEIDKTFKELMSINLNGYKTYVIFALYLKKVVNNPMKAKDIYAGVLNARESLGKVYQVNDPDEQYGCNSQATVLLISAEKHNCGEILNANTEIKQILGYSREEILGNNITQLIPYEKLRRYHTDIILSYVMQPEERGAEAEKEVFGQDNKGFLCSLVLLTHMVPSIDQGLTIMVFLSHRKQLGKDLLPAYPETRSNEVAIFILDSKLFIHAFNRKAISFCGLQPKNVNPFNYHASTRKISISSLYPEIFNSQTELDLFSYDGIETLFCANQLREAFLAEVLDYDAHELENYEENMSDLGRKGNMDTIDDLLIETEYNSENMPVIFKAKSYNLNNSTNNKTLEFCVLTLFLCSEGSATLERSLSSISDDWRTYYQTRLAKDDFSLELDESGGGSVSGSSIVSLDGQDGVKFLREFKLSLSENKTPKTVRHVTNIAIILFTILIFAAVGILIFELRSEKQVADDFGDILHIDELIMDISVLPLLLRNLLNVLYQIEPNSSPIIIQQTRFDFYKAQILAAAENLKLHSRNVNSIMSVLNEEDSFYETLIIYKDINNEIKEERIKLIKALDTILARLQIYSTISESDINSDTEYFNNAQTYQYYSNTFYIIKNCENGIRAVLLKIADQIIDVALDDAYKQLKLRLILIIICTVITIIALFGFIPIIIIPIKHIKMVFGVFAELKVTDMQELAESSNEFVIVLDQTFYQTLEYLDKVEFDDISEKEMAYLEEHTTKNYLPAARAIKKNKPNENDDDDILPLQQENVRDEQMTRNINVMKRKKHINTILKVLNNKLLVLVVTSLILCSLFLSIVFVYYAKDKEAISFSFNYLKDLSLREANIAITLFILKEEIYTSSILLDSAVHQDKAGTKHESYLLHYISEISSIEREIVEKRKDLKEFSLELKNDLFDMHSPNFCSYIRSGPNITICEKAGMNILSVGMHLSIAQILNQFERYQSQFELVYPHTRQQVADALSSPNILNLTDVICYYLFDAFTYQLDKFDEEFGNYIDENTVIVLLEFFLLIFIILFMFIFATFFVIRNFNKFIHNIKRMMTIVPAHLMPLLDIRKSYEKLSQL